MDLALVCARWCWQEQPITNVDHRVDVELIRQKLASQPIDENVQTLRIKRLLISTSVLPEIFR
jgi:hypothetical protein